MLERFTVTLIWNYPLNEAVGADRTELSLESPATPRALISESVRLYPSLKEVLDRNSNGEYAAMVIEGKRLTQMDIPLSESCCLQVHATIGGG